MKKEQLSLAISSATLWHEGQFDKGGNPYIEHPLTVMFYLDTDDKELKAIAVLHDVVEDCGVTYDDLWKKGFTERVVEGVRGMTKVPGESINDNLRRMMKNPDVVEVKLRDLRHNMDPRRLHPDLGVKDMNRMNKYMYMYRMLVLHKTGILRDEDWSTNGGERRAVDGS